MTSFTVLLADIPVGIHCIYASTKSFLKNYLTDAEPAFGINISEEDIAYERNQSIIQNERDGRQPHRHSDSYLELLAVLRKTANQLIRYNTVLFHGVAVVVDQYAYIFTAPSGTGKTTHAKMWLEQVPGAFILNGDKPFIRVNEGKVYVYGSPWQGKENYGCNGKALLRGVCLIERGKENQIETISYSEAFLDLINQTHKPDNELLSTLDVLGRISQSVNLYRLRCNMDRGAARVSSEFMVRTD